MFSTLAAMRSSLLTDAIVTFAFADTKRLSRLQRPWKLIEGTLYSRGVYLTTLATHIILPLLKLVQGRFRLLRVLATYLPTVGNSPVSLPCINSTRLWQPLKAQPFQFSAAVLSTRQVSLRFSLVELVKGSN
jgi:hypothetical protein